MSKDLEELRKNPSPAQADKDKAEALQTRLAQMMIESSRSNYHVKGEVVDEDGKRMEGVTMTIVRVQAPHMGPGLAEIGGQREQETHVINGEFEASATGWWGMGVHFEKEGFYPEKISLMDGGMTVEQAKTLLAGGAITPSTVIKNGWRVVMLQRSTPSRTLFRSDGVPLEIKSDGSGQSVIIQRPENDRLPTNKYENGEIKGLPVDSLTLEISTVQATKKFDWSDKTIYGDIRIPREIKVRFQSDKGGLVYVKPHRPFHFLLREAPEEGYQKEIVFTPQEMIDSTMIASDDPGGAFFYFKTSDGKYGKCKIYNGRFDPKSGIAKFRIWIWLQTDGSRNVRTG
jgi:hypothetical protein